MSEWHGLHNPERHAQFGESVICDQASCLECEPAHPCRCCLVAEVEALRARNETLIATIQRQDSTFERQMEEHEELEALRAQVQAVRQLREQWATREVTDAEFEMYQELGRALGSGSG